MREFLSLDVPGDFESKLKQWAASQPVCCMLQSNSAQQVKADAYSQFEWCVAVGAASQFSADKDSFSSLRDFHKAKKDWLFGFLTYDLKNQVEDLHSSNADGLRFPLLHFFQPEFIFIKDSKGLRLGYLSSPEKVLSEISSFAPQSSVKEEYQKPIAKINRQQYLSDVGAIRKHILAGDVFELNYCIEFFSQQKLHSPYALFEQMNDISPMPFSCFYRLQDQYALCASPERFLAKHRNQMISQPIKGTARRGATPEADKVISDDLLRDKKEKAENVMIVDLVRNDLSRTAVKGSVKVESLSSLHSFKNVHQLISTVTSELAPDRDWVDALVNAFPMGSMTGAPKVRSMQLIEKYEHSRRGLYSGAIGYITPSADFDFNVVIRSILYNDALPYLSFTAGSAITSDAVPEKEYDECLLKAETMSEALKKYAENLEAVANAL